MAIIITDNFNGIEVKKAKVKIEYITVNRTGFFDNLLPKFSINIFLEFSQKWIIYRRTSLSIDDIWMNEWTMEFLYWKIKEIDIFTDWVDSLPVYSTYIQ